MRFNDFLNEYSYDRDGKQEGRKTPIAEEEAMGIIKQSCKNITSYYKNNKERIYRGSSRINSDFAITDPEQYERKSRNTYNFYTLLMDNLPNWSAYPKRSKSLVCSTNQNSAANYGGQVFLLFPFDSCKIGVCPSTDVWGTTIAIDVGWGKLAWDSIGGILRNMGFVDTDWQELANDLRGFTQKDSRNASGIGIPAYGESPLLTAFAKSKSKNLLAFFQKMMNPKDRGFTLIPTSGPLPSENRELWIGGDKIVSVDVGNYGTMKEDAFIGQL